MTTPATRTLMVGDKPRRKIRRYRLQSLGGAPHEFQSQLVRVGSRPGNDLILEDSAVSRIHFEIAADHIGYRIRDLDSRNGTWVDGYRVVEMYLRSGCVIRAGGSELRFSLLEEEVDIPATSSAGYGPLVGSSLPMREIYALVDRAAPTDVTVLIQGETGTGKELVARAFHERSSRAQGPFVVLDCGAVPATLLESEIFGHEKGAFTGARYHHKGKFEQADGGTIFLDEIGEVSAKMQVELLRVLEEKSVTRVGGGKPVPTDFRVVAATHRDLRAVSDQGEFRDDLFWRLNVVSIEVPPLRERPGDIAILARYFLDRFSSSMNRRPMHLSAEALELLGSYAWPGNVRELQNAIERAVVLGKTPEIRPSDLPLRVAQAAGRAAPRTRSLSEMERAHIRAILDETAWNITHAARILDVDRGTLYNKIRRYELERPGNGQ